MTIDTSTNIPDVEPSKTFSMATCMFVEHKDIREVVFKRIQKNVWRLQASITDSTPVFDVKAPTIVNFSSDSVEPMLVLEWLYKGDRVSLFVGADEIDICLVRWLDGRIVVKTVISNGLEFVRALIDLYSHKE